jgi:arginine utilization protein RocB
MTLSRTPAQVLKEMTALAGQALAEALEQARENAKSFGDEAFRTFTEETLRVGTSERGEYPVRTYQDVRALARDVYDRTNASAGTSLEAYEEAFLAALPSGMDERDRALALMGEVVNLSGLKGPLAVVGFVPPYYPHRGNLRCSDKEHALLEALAAVAAKGREEFGEEIAYVEYFGGITDMSFLGFQGEPEALAALAENMPGWGKLYSLPLEDLLRLDVPVANIGPAGKDAHKDTERLELDFSLRVAPELLRCAVEHLGRS